MSGSMIVLLAVAAAVLLVIVIFNRLIALRQAVKNAFADIDVQIKQRYDLIPNLVETVKGYAAHESSVLDAVTKARSQAMHAKGIGDRTRAENALSGALMQILAVAENYPQLKANENFKQLQTDLSDLENKISASRRFFNNAVAEYNTALGQFPGVILAGLFCMSPEPMFDLGSEREKTSAAPKVSFGP